MFAKFSLCAVLTALMFAPVAVQAKKPAASDKPAEQQAIFQEGVKQLSDAEKLLMRKFIIGAANVQMQREVANNPEFKEVFQSINIALQQEDTISYQVELRDNVFDIVDGGGDGFGDFFAQAFASLTAKTMCQKTEQLNIVKTLGFSHFAIELTHQGKTFGQSRQALPDCAAASAQ